MKSSGKGVQISGMTWYNISSKGHRTFFLQLWTHFLYIGAKLRKALASYAFKLKSNGRPTYLSDYQAKGFVHWL